jgi:hypothetical protein
VGHLVYLDAMAPDFFDDPHVEVVAAVTQPDPGGMLSLQDERTGGP